MREGILACGSGPHGVFVGSASNGLIGAVIKARSLGKSGLGADTLEASDDGGFAVIISVWLEVTGKRVLFRSFGQILARFDGCCGPGEFRCQGLDCGQDILGVFEVCACSSPQFGQVDELIQGGRMGV